MGLIQLLPLDKHITIPPLIQHMCMWERGKWETTFKIHALFITSHNVDHKHAIHYNATCWARLFGGYPR